MKKIFYLIAALLLGSLVQVHAQVTIGSMENPHPAAILDLQSTDKGFLLPRVSLTDANTFLQESLSDPEKEAAIGLLVFNDGKATPTHLDAGLYLWTGKKWKSVLITSHIGIEASDNPNEVSSLDVLGTE
jgi:hypothetical protein